ncbi:SDR family oxidoreductase [Loigolactobacillus coryniformis]|uniref:Short-chain dehydrogenase/oxidoreductase n=1 Tax=Loigolactobacillus coryniformis subsp. coryniformis CECT 5711 TaxID=1185325 RepID=J3J9T5_9LACO|nr:SDR family oxidoreductase [Loigolactobacillus coryniformis]EJN54257.1 Short-chain dehydrogenase/oxidoreductase [Loigolactobacillus coryniformis subsp. coryniformis CECT 5711]
MSIENKVVIITGASSGIGAATAKVLAKKGAKVVLGARRAERLNELVATITATGGQAIAQVTDVTDKKQVQALADLAVAKFGRLDVLFNNAGLMPLSELHLLKVAEWERMIDVNIKGVLYGIAAALPIMHQQGGGQIIATDSVAGHFVHPNTAVYAGTKFAVRTIMEGLRQEEGKNHIRAMIVSPGAVETELYSTITDPAVRENTYHNERSYGLKDIDVANAVAYAIDQPENVSINEILLRLTEQPL